MHRKLTEDEICRLKKKLGQEPSEEQLATSMRISRTDLRTKQIECSLARQKLTMSNVRLVMSIAQKYDNMGAQMADLIQVAELFLKCYLYYTLITFILTVTLFLRRAVYLDCFVV